MTSKMIKKFETKGLPLIKFQDADKIEGLRKGHLYAKTLEYYRKLEEETGDCRIGDLYEGTIHVNNAFAYLPDTGESAELYNVLLKTTASNPAVFCMFGFQHNLTVFEFSEEQKKEMLSFGNTALVVTDREEFIARIKCAALKEGFIAHIGRVAYYDPSIDSVDVWNAISKDICNVALLKRNIYSYQQEERIIFSGGKLEEDHIILDIGDISDISEVVSSKEAFSFFIIKNEENK